MTTVLLAAAGVSACEIERVQIPRTQARVAVHAILSPTAPTQVVLLERTRNGSVSLFGPGFDVGDPVVSGDGIAESDALISLTLPDGQRFFAVEDKNVRHDLKGRGIYRFYLPGASFARGIPYRLNVLTAKGEVLTGETAIPGGLPADSATRLEFDRSRDTLALSWPSAPGARAYFVRIDTPFGPRSFFVDTTHVRLTGDLRNVDLTALRRVFIPGYPQSITVSAVDSNYYDWYRSKNNELTGVGLVSHVEGGFGLFGSLVRLRYDEATVVAPQTEPVAGRFEYTGDQRGTTPYLTYTIYVESKSARADQADALSGRYTVRPRFGYTGCLTCGLLGTIRGNRVELKFLSGWSAKDTVETLVGELRGDTIVGSYNFAGGIVRFVKQR